MTMKLPILLSTMMAALAIPATLAGDANQMNAGGNPPMDASGNQQMDASGNQPADASATPENTSMDSNAAPAMEETKTPPKKKKRHHRKRSSGGGVGHTRDKWDQPYDQVNKDSDSSGAGCSGSSSSDAGKTLPEEVPGQKGPNVPRGE